jgi:[ribosomal protein S5]-alanine N-acetyltransferase
MPSVPRWLRLGRGRFFGHSVMPELETSRLTITSLTLDRVHAAISDRPLLGAILGANIPDDWPNQEFADALPVFAQWLLEDVSYAEWVGLIIHREDNTLIGDIGFKGRPNADGSVEIGYGIVPSYRNQGYASEAARAMVEWAFSHDDVQRVLANCLNDNIASIRVLEHIGMRQVGASGPLLDWAIERAPSGR